MKSLIAFHLASLCFIYNQVLRLRIKIASAIIGSTVPLFRLTSPPSNWPFSLKEQRQFPDGSLGKEIACALDRQGFDLIPKFESHDAEHVLFGYDMSGLGEIRLQIFLLGNGRYNWVAIGTTLFGLGSFPELTWLFLRDFIRGREYRNLNGLHLGNYLEKQTVQVRAILRNNF